MGGYHMRAELPPEATDQEVKEIRAAAFETALRHAASDPLMRLQMILGETYQAYKRVIDDCRRKLEKENPEVRALAERCIAEPHILERNTRDIAISNAQQLLLEAACPEE